LSDRVNEHRQDAHHAKRRTTWGELLVVLDAVPRPDAAFIRDLEKVRREQPRLPKDPWASSAARRS